MTKNMERDMELVIRNGFQGEWVSQNGNIGVKFRVRGRGF